MRPRPAQDGAPGATPPIQALPIPAPPIPAPLLPTPVCLALFALALVPTLAVPIPAMADYPNHLARMYLLAGGEHPHYRVAWGFYPNLAMDLLVPPLSRLVGVEAAARLFLLAAQALVLTGAVALERAVKGRQQVSGLLALLALHCLPFAWGFVNFEFGLGLALWGAAAWIGRPAASWPTRAAVHVAATAAGFVAHLFALGIYGFVLGLHEAWRFRTGRSGAREALARFGLLAAPALVLAGLMAAAGGAVGEAGTSWNGGAKPFWPILLLNGYDRGISVATWTILAVLALLAARRGWLRLEPGGGVMLAGFGLLYLAMPGVLQDTAFVDVRVLAAALLVIPAYLVIGEAARVRAAAALLALGLLNVGWASALWWSYRADYADLIASFGRIERGARVIVGHTGTVQDPPIDHLAEYPIYNAPTLAVPYADAFVPTLFTGAGKQPVVVRPESRRLAVPYGGPVPMADLRASAEGRPGPETPGYAHAWTRDFAYLYLLGPQDGNPMPERLEPLAASRRFGLYRIRRDP